MLKFDFAALTAGDLPEDVRDPSASHLVHLVLNFLRILRFYRHVMIGCLLAAILLGGLYFASATRYYKASASVLILQSGGDVLNPTMNVESSKQEIIPTYTALLEEAVVLKRALECLPAEFRVDFQGVPREKWLETFEDRLAAVAVRRTNIIEAHYQSRDPKAAEAVLRAVLDAYFEFIDGTHKGTAGEIMDILLHEKVELEKKLEVKQRELLEARRVLGDLGIKPGGQIVHPLVQRAVRLSEAMVEVQEKRLELQSSLAAIQGALRRGEELQQHLLAVEAAVGREILLTGLGFNTRDAGVQANLERNLLEDQAELKTAEKYLGPNHPKISEITERIQATRQYMTASEDRLKNRLSQLQDTQLGPMLVQMLGQALGKAWEQETALRKSFEQASRDAVKLNGDLAQLEILEHDWRRLQGLHDVLVDRIANTDLRQERGDIWARVVKEPTAFPRPVSPRLAIVALVCLAGSLAVGCTAVYVLDVLDDRFRSPEELRIRLGIPVLAMVRQLDIPDGTGFDGVQTHVAPDGVESEAFRTLRTALAFSPHETERIVISSSEPGDGKTTVLVNLAVSSAQSGKRTLLIDADLRRPGLTSLLGLKGEEGLSGLLRGDEDVASMASQLVRKTPVERLDVLTSGPRRPNPSELLAGPRFSDLLAWAESNYDQVLIDSPPVLAASDAQIIGRTVDGVILVVHTEKNRRRVVVRAVDGFSSLGIHMLGVVANRVRPRGAGDYGYGYGYGYVYEEHEDEHDAEHDAEHGAVQGAEHEAEHAGDRDARRVAADGDHGLSRDRSPPADERRVA